MLSLFYRAWANTEPTVHFDRPESDRYSFFVGSLIGLGMPSLRKRDDISDQTKFFYAGRLACQTKCADGLREVLRDYLELPVAIEEFAGEWMSLPQQHTTRLGEANNTLGDSLIVGARVWGCQHKFRIVLGPLGIEDYQRFLPTGNRFRHLITLVRNYAGDELAWDVNLVLRWEEIPRLRLDGNSRLGWTTKLGEREGRHDMDDLTLPTDRYIYTGKLPDPHVELQL